MDRPGRRADRDGGPGGLIAPGRGTVAAPEPMVAGRDRWGLARHRCPHAVLCLGAARHPHSRNAVHRHRGGRAAQLAVRLAGWPHTADAVVLALPSGYGHRDVRGMECRRRHRRRRGQLGHLSGGAHHSQRWATRPLGRRPRRPSDRDAAPAARPAPRLLPPPVRTGRWTAHPGTPAGVRGRIAHHFGGAAEPAGCSDPRPRHDRSGRGGAQHRRA